MADVLSIFLLILGAILVFNAYWLAAVSLAPSLVERCRQCYARPFRMTGLGLLFALPFAVAVFLLAKMNHPVGNILAFASVGLPVVLGLAGSAGVSLRIGAGLFGSAKEKEPWQQVLPGGFIFTLTMLLPFIGWFVILPGALLSGLGAALTSMIQLRNERLETIIDDACDRTHSTQESEIIEDSPRKEPASSTSAQT